jgi:hypothetical protein
MADCRATAWTATADDRIGSAEPAGCRSGRGNPKEAHGGPHRRNESDAGSAEESSELASGDMRENSILLHERLPKLGAPLR